VNMATTANRKKLFFNLRAAKSKISVFDNGDIRHDQVETIAKRLGVTKQDVIDMNGWLSGDASLNAPFRADSDSGEWLDWLVDEGASQETTLAASNALRLSARTGEGARRFVRRRDCACRSHGHRPRQGAALFVGRAGEQHWVPAIRVFSARGLHAVSGQHESIRARRGQPRPSIPNGRSANPVIGSFPSPDHRH
jgi:hypothetical protein